MALALGLEVAYNTNINASGIDPIGDISLTPRFSIGVHWPITRQNELHFQLGLQYRRYLFHPDYSLNRFIIDPGTLLEYRVFTGDFVFTIYDVPAIYTEPDNDPGIFNTVNFQQLQNTAGISIHHNLNKLVTTLGFERVDTRSLSGTYESNNGVSYRVYGTTFYSVTPTTRIGVRGVLSTRDYTNNTLNNYVSTLAGAVITGSITPLTSYHVEMGIQSASYSATGKPESELTFTEVDGFNENVRGTLGGGNYVQPYFRIGISSQLTRHIQHSASFVREAEPSSVSNYTEQNTIAYNVDWRLNRVATLALYGGYTLGQISSSTTPIDYWQLNLRSRLSLEITRDTNLAFFYDYLVNDLAVSNGSYDRSRFGVSLGWTF
jgi:hypothetical protein